MKVISVNVGLPKDVEWQGKLVRTSIWKNPVSRRIAVSRLNLAGDQQSDLSVHGGPDKAVYAYPSEHYDFWRRVLGVTDLPWASFGENLTTEGLLEDQVRIGDRIRIGSAVFVVTQPRTPCFKLGIRFGDMQMVKRFLESRRSGFYFSVSREGTLQAGDPIQFEDRDENALTIEEVFDLYTQHSENQQLLRRAIQLPALPAGWKEYFRKRLSDLHP